MIARAYYNEIDPFAAAWLRRLMAAGVIAPSHAPSHAPSLAPSLAASA